MARANFMDTKPASYLELMGNGKVYSVPPFQRDYSWKEEQWEDLWKDILDLRSDADAKHYMGAMVVQSLDDREFLIIDGQQRMATLALLTLAVISRLEALAAAGVSPDENRARARECRRFIGEKDPASLLESSRLTLNGTDNEFFQDYLVQGREPRNPRGLPRSNRLIWECREYFRRQLAGLEDVSQDGEALARLLAETVARQMVFILITVDDVLNAYTVFETLNARGLVLTTTDLIKNYLFSRVRVRADLEALQRRWSRLMATVAAERFPEFLRYHLLCDKPRIRSQRLFKEIRETAKSPEQVFALIDELDARAELFAALLDPQHGYWIDLQAAQELVEELRLFRVRQMTPLLFAAWERLDPSDFVRILKLVRTVSFRYTIVSSLNTNDLEPVYHDAAKALLTGRATTPAQVFERLATIYVDDEKFRSDFRYLELSTAGSQRKLAKYILCKLESDASGRHCDHRSDPATVEHILPENPAAEWDAEIPEKHWDMAICRLGNLTLLERPANCQVGNLGYTEKRAAYEKSDYALTRGVAEMAPEEWSLNLLDLRQQRLAERAAHVWRADFA